MHFKRNTSSHTCRTFSTVEMFCRSWHAEHFCNLNFPSISNSFWDIRRKVLKFYKFDEKRSITPRWVIRFTSNCSVGKSWHTEHVCCLNLTFISYRFWNKGRILLQFRKFDEKRAITPKWERDLIKNCRVGRSWHATHLCNLNLTSISYSFWNTGRKVLKFWKFDEKREITPKWVMEFT
jgi:hypothetical protein